MQKLKVFQIINKSYINAAGAILANVTLLENSNIEYHLIDTNINNNILPFAKVFQENKVNFKYILIKDSYVNLDKNINNIINTQENKFILLLEKLEYINLKITDNIQAQIAREINKNKIHIYKYKEERIKVEKNIFKKIKLYFEK